MVGWGCGSGVNFQKVYDPTRSLVRTRYEQEKAYEYIGISVKMCVSISAPSW